MNSVLSAILRRALRKPGDPVEVLTFPLPDGVMDVLSQTGYRFWMVGGKGGEGIVTLSSMDEMKHHEVDLVLTGRDHAHLVHARRFSQYGYCPHVCVWHDMPPAVSTPRIEKLSQVHRGDYNVFTSKKAHLAWTASDWEVDTRILSTADVVGWTLFLEEVATKGCP